MSEQNFQNRDVMAYYDGPKKGMAGIIAPFRGAIRGLFGLSFVITILTIAVPIFLMLFFDGRIALGERSFGMLGMLAIAVILGLNFLIRYVRSSMIGQILYKIDSKVSSNILEHVFKIPMRDKKMDSFWHSVFMDIDVIRGGLTSGYVSNLLDTPFLLLIMATMGVLFGKYFFIVLLFAAIYIAFIMVTIRAASAMDDREKLAIKERDELVTNTVYSMGTIKTMLITDKVQKTWEDYQAAIVEATYKRSYVIDMCSVLSYAIYLLGLVIFSVVGVYSMSRGTMSIGVIIACIILFSINFFILHSFIRNIPEYFRFTNSTERLGQVIREQETKSKVEIIEDVTTGELSLDKATILGEKENIIVNAQSFTFKDGKTYIVKAKNAFEGTLFLKTLFGGYTADEGTIMFDRYDISRLMLKSIKDYIHYAAERYFVIDGTIKENLCALLSENADPGYAGFIDYKKAAEMLGLDAIIGTLPNKYNTIIDSKTTLLSEEELKLISLARTFVGNPRVMLFDQPFLGLSLVSRAKFTEAVTSIEAERIVIISEQGEWTNPRVQLSLNNGIIKETAENGKSSDEDDGSSNALFRRIMRKK